jgi:hypothetical protein
LNAANHSDQPPSPSPTRTARKGAGRGKGKSKKKEPPIEYIKVPKKWFSNPLNHAMTTVVRPPTKMTRRKELTIDLKIPMEVFIDLMKPMETGDMEDFEWEGASEKTELKPTKKFKTYHEFKYTIKKPSLVDKFWRLEEREPARWKKGVRKRRGLGSSRLHLSAAAEERGERTDLLAGVTGNVTVHLKMPMKERAMPQLRIHVKVSTLSKTGHVEWANLFAPKTAAALRKQMQQHLRTMVESKEYPTLSTNDVTLLGESTESIRAEPLALMPPRPGA